MLVLSRKIGEVITIGSSVKVTVLSFDRGIVRMGIEAPKSIPVHRKEIHDKIVEMNKQASKTEFSAFKNALTMSDVKFESVKINSAFSLPSLQRKSSEN
ncbi:MAG: carbon storage regulator CsrA [Candidatus Kapabacteria bacterium]|jgi:carbon storage regulator|nr:carbon storage regulator CsrA [Candidatus Kapabacteria bacterium]